MRPPVAKALVTADGCCRRVGPLVHPTPVPIWAAVTILDSKSGVKLGRDVFGSI